MTEETTMNELTAVELDRIDTVRAPPLFLDSSPCASLEELRESLQQPLEKGTVNNP